MDESEKPSIDEILRVWKARFAVKKTSERGTSYYQIPTQGKVEAFDDLVQTLLDYGFSHQQLNQPILAAKIANICWRREKIIKFSDKQVNRFQGEDIEDWYDAIARHSDKIKISKSRIEVKETELTAPAPKPKEESKLEEIDLSGIEGPKYIVDTEIEAELAALGMTLRKS